MSTERDDCTSTDASSTYNYFWRDDRGRQYVSDSNDIVPLAKLTAFAEYGDKVLEADHVHHALTANVGERPPIRVNAPEFLVPLDKSEHLSLHHDEEWGDVGGIPLLLPEDGHHGGSVTACEDGSREHERPVVGD